MNIFIQPTFFLSAMIFSLKNTDLNTNIYIMYIWIQLLKSYQAPAQTFQPILWNWILETIYRQSS